MTKVRLGILMAGILGIAVFLGLNVPAQQEETVTLTLQVVGFGTVHSENGDCTGQCIQTYAKGSSVTLRAEPADEWSFVGWEPECGEELICTVTMDDARSIAAIFTYP